MKTHDNACIFCDIGIHYPLRWCICGGRITPSFDVVVG
jgi:hypothetical protein